MIIAPLPHDEEERLAALHEYQILDTAAETIFDRITLIASHICGVPISLITLIDRDRQWFKSKIGIDENETKRETAFCSHAILDSKILEVPDATKDDRFFDNPYVTKDPNIRFYAGVPLVNPKGFKLGTLCVIDRQPKKLTDVQRDALKNLSEIVMSFFEIRKSILSDINQRKIASEALGEVNAKLKKKLAEQKQSRQELLLLSEMSSVLQACMNAEETFGVITKFCSQLFPKSKGTLFLLHANHEHIERVASWGDVHQNDFFSLDSCWALRRNQPHYVSDPNKDLICQHMKSIDEIPCYICLPLMAQGEVSGLITLELSKQFFNEAQKLLAAAMAEQVALALSNAKLRETLHQQSVRDPLTGLYNRRHLIESLKKCFLRFEKQKINLAFILIDIDYFKKFNDTYGHDAGDVVLKYVAKLLIQHAKQENGNVFRFGGEEFIVTLENFSQDKAQQFAEKLRQAIQEIQPSYNGLKLNTITFSIGVAIYPEHGTSLDKLFKAADTALYKAKENGRNKVIMAQNAFSMSAKK